MEVKSGLRDKLPESNHGSHLRLTLVVVGNSKPSNDLHLHQYSPFLKLKEENISARFKHVV